MTGRLGLPGTTLSYSGKLHILETSVPGSPEGLSPRSLAPPLATGLAAAFWSGPPPTPHRPLLQPHRPRQLEGTGHVQWVLGCALPVLSLAMRTLSFGTSAAHFLEMLESP